MTEPTAVQLPVPDSCQAVIVDPFSCSPAESPAANGAVNVPIDVEPPPLSFLRRSQRFFDGVTRRKYIETVELVSELTLPQTWKKSPAAGRTGTVR